jgi:hypothetical protein
MTPSPWLWSPAYDASVEMCVAALGDDVFRAHYQRGADQTTTDVVGGRAHVAAPTSGAEFVASQRCAPVALP